MSEPALFTPDLDEPGEAVAIVGMAGRFPGALDLEAFWRNLRDGVESIATFSDAELLAAGVSPALLSHPRYVKARGVLSGVELFDAPFFGFSPREAAITDPQHRVFLECAWEALEQAGVDPETCPGRIGVYAGSIVSTYLLFHLFPQVAAEDEAGWQMMLANDKDALATRVSYKLNLKGPSVSVQTACSTSLVAIHMARQSLLDYECDLALAGGVSVRSPQNVGYLYQEAGIHSPDGHCRAFDARARGTVFSGGAGIVVLKRLADALADGDTVRALLVGSAINNDGAQKVGFTAPSVEGQAEVIARALALGGVDPETIQYVEAHGTATPLGDPIEIAALTRAFRASTDRRGFCAVGSVKSNIGHLDSAAGIAGLIKTVLALEHRQIPPSLHFERPNPQIDFAASPFFVNDRLRQWERGERGEGPRRAGVSSFGIGGTNAHVVVEEAPPAPPGSPARPWQLLVLSAKTEPALALAAARLAEHLELRPEQELADVAHTLQVGRRAFPFRRSLVCGSREEARAALAAHAAHAANPGLPAGRPAGGTPAVAFLFPGQGSQRLDMGRELYDAEPLFRREVDRAAEILRPHLGEDLRPLLFPATERREEAARRLARTAVAQPALFVVETALARLWMSWGIRPQAMLGHSIGEYVAAHLAGVLSLDDALELVAARGRLVEELPGGAMLAVPLPEGEVAPLLGSELAVAAVNTPLQCVVSGPEPEIEALCTELEGRGIAGRRLTTSHAFHGRQMDRLVEPFTRIVGRFTLRPPEIPYLSNVSGRWATAAGWGRPWRRGSRGGERRSSTSRRRGASGRPTTPVSSGACAQRGARRATSSTCAA
jgi:acyl transferase domain-containing protein